MKALALVLFLSGCAAMPDNASFMFRCMEGRLFVAAVPDGQEEGYVAEVGYCENGQAIIGKNKGKPVNRKIS